MFSCVRYCTSQHNYKYSCGIESSNLDTLYNGKDRNAGGVVNTLAASLPVKVIQSL